MRLCLAMSSLVALSACSPAPAVVGGGPDVSRAYAAAGFDGVSVTGSDTVRIVEGEGFLVTANGPKALVDNLEISAISNMLVIDRKAGDKTVMTNKGVTITVQMPSIQRVELNGSADIDVSAPATGSFAVALAGSGNVAIKRLRATTAHLSLTGSGALNIAGSTGAATIDVQGSGDVDAAAMKAGDMTINSAGPGDIKAVATGKVTGALAGPGNITVRGTEACTVTVAGPGTFTCKR